MPSPLPISRRLAQFDRGGLSPDEAELLAQQMIESDARLASPEDETLPSDLLAVLTESDAQFFDEPGLAHAREALLQSPEPIEESWIERTVSDDPPAAEIKVQWALPKRIDAYEIERRLGRGAMGFVYRARHMNLKNAVALKVLSPTHTTSPRAVELFYREMQALGQLRHPNVVQALHAGQSEGLHFLAMELVDGFDVGRLLASAGPLPVADACEIVRQASLGLAAAHRRRLVHRDIKPSNLMVTRSGRVKILDLGLASVRIEHGPEGTEELPAGTADYMAPEQWRAATVDARADLYSLGCTLFKLLTGRTPFDAACTNRAKMEAHASQAPPALRAVRPEILEGVERIVATLLAKSPDERLGDADELARALEPYSGGNNLAGLVQAVAPRTEADGPADSLERPTLIELPRRPPIRRRWLLTAAAAVAGLVLAATIVIRITDRGNVTVTVEESDEGERILAPVASFDLASGPLEVARLTPAGDKIIAAGLDGRIRLIDLASGNQVHSWVAHEVEEAEVVSVDVDPAGKFVVTGGKDGQVAIWDLPEGTLRHQLVSGGEVILCVRISPDGKLLLTGGTDGDARLWDLATFELRHTLRGQESWVRDAAFGPENRFALTCGNDAKTLVWDLATGELRGFFTGHKAPVSSVDLTPDGRFAVTGSWDGTVRIWDVPTGTLVRMMAEHTGTVRHVQFLGSVCVLSASEDHDLRVWNPLEGTSTIILRGHSDAAMDTDAQADQRQLISVSVDGTIRRWRLPEDWRPASVDALARTIDNKRQKPLDEPVAEWRIADSPVRGLVATADGSQLAAYTQSGELVVIDAATGQRQRAFENPPADVTAVAYDLHGAPAIGTRDGLVLLFNRDAGAAHQLQAHADWVSDLAFSADGALLATCGFDGMARVWEVETQTEIASHSVADYWLHAVTLAGGENIVLYTGGTTGSVYAWTLDADAPATQYGEPFTWHVVSSVTVSEDGRWVAVAGWQPDIRLWDNAERALVKEFKGHTTPVCDIALAPDARILVSAGEDGVVRVWDRATGRTLRTLRAHHGAARAMAIRGQRLFSTGDDGTIREWSLEATP